MGVFYVIHVIDPHSAIVFLSEVLIAAFAYKIVVGIVTRLFKKD